MNNKNEIHFRKANETDIPVIWEIIQQSIERRRKDGSQQWQNGYPNLQTVESDVSKEFGYVITVDNEVKDTHIVAKLFLPEV
ncbi:hypothetical protein AB4Y90_15200 [Chryseobacterium sp. 2TAF14]|uniref:hypothetical protein n=1 Tax=Chryseobacterium sp. 2TAF14 TaxID=3233007 RepID=UPI003F93E460